MKVRTMKHPFKQRVLTVSVLGLAGTILTGCGTVHQDVDRLKEKTTATILQEHAKAEQPIPVVTSTTDSWILGPSIQVVPTQSPILQRKMVYHPTQRVTLADVAAWVNQKTGLSIDVAEVQATAPPNANTQQVQQPLYPQASTVVPSLSGRPPLATPAVNASGQPFLSFDGYDGPLSGLLDVAANKAGVWWKFEDGAIVFYRTETRTFYLPAISQISTGSSAISANTAGGSGATNSANASSTTGVTANNSVYVVDVWGSLEKTAQTVAGPTAKVVANPSVGSLTITGTPTQVRNVDAWVKNLADNLSQQVAVTVHVYKVAINKEDNYNWNPSVVFKSLSNVYGITTTPLSAPNTVSGATPLGITASVLSSATGEASQWNGTQLAFRALSTLGTVTETVRQNVVTLNGQPAPMQIANSLTYLASTTQGVASTAGGAVPPPSITPGTLTTGFTAMFLPRVVNGKILLVMNLTSSSLVNIGTQSSGGSTIQTPNVDLSTFQQSASLTPGDALLLTGIQQDNGATSHTGTGSPTNVLFGGGVDNTTGKNLIAIVITAKVL